MYVIQMWYYDILKWPVAGVREKEIVAGRPRIGHEVPEGEQKCDSTVSLTSALERGGRLTPRPGRFIPGKDTRYPLYRRLRGPQGRSGRVRKKSHHSSRHVYKALGKMRDTSSRNGWKVRKNTKGTALVCKHDTWSYVLQGVP